jgi:hypothetical protein
MRRRKSAFGVFAEEARRIVDNKVECPLVANEGSRHEN